MLAKSSRDGMVWQASFHARDLSGCRVCHLQGVLGPICGQDIPGQIQPGPCANEVEFLKNTFSILLIESTDAGPVGMER